MNAGSALNSGIGNTAAGPNDFLAVSNTLALNGTVINLKAPSAGASLDTSTDYTLVTAGNITGTPALNWVAGFVPANTNNYSLVKTATSIKLHFVNTTVVGSLVFQQQPASTNAGSVILPGVTVLVEDTNNVALSNAVVTLSLSNSAVPLNGATFQSTDANGLAAFTNLSVNAAGIYVLQAVAGIAPLVTNFSSPFTISSAAAAKLVIATQPSAAATAGVAFSTQPVLVVLDAFGNAVSNSAASITAAASSGNLQGTTTVPANGVSGSAAFTDLSLTNAGSVTLTFSSAGLAPTNSTAIIVSAAAAAALVWAIQPGAAVYGTPFGQQPVLKTKDQFGNDST